MERPRKTEDKKDKPCQAHCPNCDIKFFSAVEAVDLQYKCFQCHRHYLINIKNGSVHIDLTYAPREKDNIDD